MATNNDVPRIAREWGAPLKPKPLTKSQRTRKERGQSIYTRDTIVEPYTVNKGQWA